MSDENKYEDKPTSEGGIFSRVIGSAFKKEEVTEVVEEPTVETVVEDVAETKPVVTKSTTKSTRRSTKSTRGSTTKTATKSEPKVSTVKVADITPARNTSVFPVEVSKGLFNKCTKEGWKGKSVSKADVSAVESILFYQAKDKVVRVICSGEVGKASKK